MQNDLSAELKFLRKCNQHFKYDSLQDKRSNDNIKFLIQELFGIDLDKEPKKIINNIKTKKLPINPIIKVQRKEDGELLVKVLNWYGKHSSLEERYPDSFSTYKKIINNGATVISDLIDQIHNLIILLNKEFKENDISNEKTIRSLKTSIILLQVCVLETICNFFAELVLNLNNDDVKGAPKPKCKLEQDKVDFLKEEYTKTNFKGEKIKKHSGNSIEEKMTEIPKILGALYDVQVSIDKSGQEWQRFKEKLKMNSEYVVVTLRDHIFKENNILYPTAKDVIEKSKWEEIKAKSDQIGYCSFTPKVEISNYN